MVTMLICSVSFATVMPSVLPVAELDVVSVADMQPTGSIITVGAQIELDNESITNIGAGSTGLFKYAMSTYGESNDKTVPCMATCNHKTTDNVTAYMAKPNEVGWR